MSCVGHLDSPSLADRPVRYSRTVDARFRDLIIRGHHVLLVGGRRADAVTLARSAVDLLPVLTPDQEREITRIYSAAGSVWGRGGGPSRRPLRQPPAHLAAPALVGGRGRIGEVSLAHHGVLVLEHAEEFGSHALDEMLQAVQARAVVTRRRGIPERMPANVRLIALAARCACARRAALAGAAGAACQCTMRERERHEQAIKRLGLVCSVISLGRPQESGPLQDCRDAAHD